MKWYSVTEVLPEVLEEVPYDILHGDKVDLVTWMEDNCPPVLAWLENGRSQLNTYIPAPQLELVKGMVEIYDATRNANLREQYAAQLVGMLKIVYGITTETYGGPDR